MHTCTEVNSTTRIDIMHSGSRPRSKKISFDLLGIPQWHFLTMGGRCSDFRQRTLN
ncbi:unnamed protein product [Chondrus crispus]|uniref:Uncharacterized protein n=1 Tax=Chondrus crispus TaxID=2769 RepID=R7QRN8_CHOCR|nr:unnamed protein product [Chondrus crispus]CDF40408.1 unnamed protein product [Chondrus crispus]|eukprot:XP_005710702.1 unnamed protein product [Chondrus crispus]